MLRNNLGKAEEILLKMIEDDDECIPHEQSCTPLWKTLSDFEKAVEFMKRC